jgi:hypothetical protein
MRHERERGERGDDGERRNDALGSIARTDVFEERGR